MKFKQPWLMATALAVSTLFSCRKETLTGSQEMNATQSLTATQSLLPVCGQYVEHLMTDYYPSGYYMNYATIHVGNDASNIYITFNSLYGFDFTKIKLVIGDLAHLQTVLSPYTDPPTAAVGPANPDYSVAFPAPVPGHTFTIPRSTIAGNCFYLYAWAYGEKWVNGWLSDWRGVWIRSTTKVNSDDATSYTQYCLQNCPPQDCGQLRTQTPGGWGAPPHGNNPGTYLHANFNAVFPNGITLGSSPSNYVKFTTAQKITDYLPAGGNAKALTQNYTNPSTNQLKNNLVNHLLALTLSVKFDAADASFGTAGIQLGDMVIGSGAFSGQTVNAFLTEANKILGGTSTAYTVQDVLTTASAINENYTDGNKDNHYLVCPNNL